MAHQLYEELKERVSNFQGWKVRQDDGQYFKADNGKKFISFNCEQKEMAWLGIREDCDTRTVFNGVVYSIEDFKTVLSLVR